ncbi:hypothetical protein TNCV_4305001 [Trichonephila clavipes]|nr:hypothetical protein TNCV_4305001 [Trichonephila clavipes]
MVNTASLDHSQSFGTLEFLRGALFGNNSARDLAVFAENANAFKRMHMRYIVHSRGPSVHLPEENIQPSASSASSSMMFSLSPLSDSSLYQRRRGSHSQ